MGGMNSSEAWSTQHIRTPGQTHCVAPFGHWDLTPLCAAQLAPSPPELYCCVTALAEVPCIANLRIAYAPPVSCGEEALIVECSRGIVLHTSPREDSSTVSVSWCQ